jgi:hypothetical protein
MQRTQRILAASVMVVLMEGAASAQQPFDGSWNLHAVPEQGTCTRALRYRVVVERGTVSSRAYRDAEVSGGLQSDGRVEGSIRRNRTQVDVSGRLTGRSGLGTWIAKGGVNCSGRWSAEKRG